MNAGAWKKTVDPKRLYVMNLTTGQMTECMVDFTINNCTLDVLDSLLVAMNLDGSVHTVNRG